MMRVLQILVSLAGLAALGGGACRPKSQFST
jgi:hypothetical protein